MHEEAKHYPPHWNLHKHNSCAGCICKLYANKFHELARACRNHPTEHNLDPGQIKDGLGHCGTMELGYACVLQHHGKWQAAHVTSWRAPSSTESTPASCTISLRKRCNPKPIALASPQEVSGDIMDAKECCSTSSYVLESLPVSVTENEACTSHQSWHASAKSELPA